MKKTPSINFVKLSSKPKFFRTIRSFVRRSGRITVAQKNAWDKHWVAYGIESGTNKLDLSALFENKNQRFVLEIGFGNGENLIDCAKNDPHSNFTGIGEPDPLTESVSKNTLSLGRWDNNSTS